MESYVITFLASLLAGFINVIAGGGTLVTFPALIWVGVEPVSANITNTVALWLGPLAGALSYRNIIKENLSSLRIFLPPSVLGAILGAFLLIHTPSDTFRKAIPFLIGFATLLLALSEFILRVLKNLGARNSSIIASTLQFATAVYGSYFGAGIGIMMVSSIVLSGISNIHVAIGLKNFLGFLINLLGAFVFLFSGKVAFDFVLVMMGGFVIGGYLGGLTAQKLNQKVVKIFIIFWGFFLSLAFFLKEFYLSP
ncbi:sulfite exporter TauE/SafE family protein [Thermocrinis sp.]